MILLSKCIINIEILSHIVLYNEFNQSYFIDTCIDINSNIDVISSMHVYNLSYLKSIASEVDLNLILALNDLSIVEYLYECNRLYSIPIENAVLYGILIHHDMFSIEKHIPLPYFVLQLEYTTRIKSEISLRAYMRYVYSINPVLIRQYRFHQISEVSYDDV